MSSRLERQLMLVNYSSVHDGLARANRRLPAAAGATTLQLFPE
jgi:hypothetical protein